MNNNKSIFFILIIIFLNNNLCLAAQAGKNRMYMSLFAAGNYIKPNAAFDAPPISTKPAYQIGIAIGYSHIFWGIRPEIELSVLSNSGIAEKGKDALGIGYAMLNFIADIPFKNTRLNTSSGTLPYIGLGIGESRCTDSNPACQGRASQFILGARSRLDSFLSTIIDVRYTVLKKTNTVSLNFGFIQKF